MRLIDAEAYETDVRKRYCKHCDNGKGLRCRVCWINDMLGEIENAPTIEAKPVVHAHWENEHLNRYGHLCHCCSNCGFSASHKDKNWCANCGAQMDEVAGDTNVGSKTE